ncbi:MAG: hypothetical protein ACM3XM_14310 [Mycobacterium leprae]
MIRRWSSSIAALYQIPTVEFTVRFLAYLTILITLYFIYTGSDARIEYIYTNF